LIILVVAIVCGCDEEYWFNADGSGRYRWILNGDDIKLMDGKNEGFDKFSEKWKETFAKTKLQATATRDVVYGKTRWILDLDYKSADQLSWVDDKGTKTGPPAWESATEPNGDLKLKYPNAEGSESNETRGGVGPKTRLITVHLPGRIITSNADTVDDEKNIATWDVTTHKSITPTVTYRPPPAAKNADPDKAK